MNKIPLIDDMNLIDKVNLMNDMDEIVEID